MRVVVEARLTSGTSGGVESVVTGLAAGLSSLTAGDDEFIFVTKAGADEWLRPYLGGACHAVPLAGTTTPLARRALRRVPGLARTYRHLRPRGPGSLDPGPSDGIAERLRADVVHFPYQRGYLTEIPTIFHPHDLQHVHLPEFFSAQEVQRREVSYRRLCEQAAMVAVASRWVREDVVTHYGLPEDRVVVVPLAPPAVASPEPSARERSLFAAEMGLPDRFIFYPAQTWPHKNHIALLEAMAILRDEGLPLSLVCSGQLTEHQPMIAAQADRLGLTGSIRWLGFVPSGQLRCLYSLAWAVIVPTLFEAASFPIWEAFRARVPVACSNVTSLPEQVGDAAVIFDPREPDQIAQAIRRVWLEDDLRSTLVARGLERLAGLSWERTAGTFCDHYRRLVQPRA